MGNHHIKEKKGRSGGAEDRRQYDEQRNLRLAYRRSLNRTPISGPCNDPQDPDNLKDPFFMLPSEIVIKILKGFTQSELANTITLVSKRWRACAYDPFLWNTFDVLIRRPESLDDAKVLGLVFSQHTRQIWNFKGCEQISSLAVLYIVSYVDKITHLNLSGCKKVDNQGIELISRSTNNSLLKDLNIAWLNKISADCIGRVAKACVNLESLNLHGIQSITSFSSIIPYLKNIKNLDLGLMNLSQEAADEAIKLIGENCSKLEYLGLREFPLSNTFVSLLEKCPQLTQLDLQSTKITKEIIMALVENCPNIQILNLKLAKWNKSDSDYLLNSISKKYNTQLKTFNIAETGATISSKTITEFLKRCTQLEEIDVSMFRSDFQLEVMKACALYCTNLKVINIHGINTANIGNLSASGAERDLNENIKQLRDMFPNIKIGL